MKITTTALIDDLLARTHTNLFAAEELKVLSYDELRSRPGPESWSALECFEHLNFYGTFYLPEIEKQMQKSSYPAEEIFKSGVLGNYFANTMLPRKNQRKIRTLRSHDPIGRSLTKEVLELFIDHQHQFLILLDKARNVGLTRTKTAISLTRFLKLRLGDTLRVLVYHNQRHVLQAQRAIENAAEHENSVKLQV